MADFKSAAKKIAKSKASKPEAGFVDRGFDALALPQKLAFKKLAEVSGVAPGESSEESAFNLVDKVASKIGIPEDSVIGNAAKAAAVAGAEVFGDPLGAVGKLGKVGKIAKSEIVQKGLRKLKPLEGITKTESGNPKTAQNIKTFAQERFSAPQQKFIVKTGSLSDEAKAASVLIKPPEAKLRSAEDFKERLAKIINEGRNKK
jgi:hypothetical protein